MATIHDIAKIAGVSTSTVSHVVNKTRYVSPELVERVESAIKQLDIPPNFVIKKAKQAQKNNAPRSNSNQYILLLIADKKSDFQKQVGQQIDRFLKDTGYSLITIGCESDIEALVPFFHTLFSASLLAGIIAFPDERDYFTSRILESQNLPVVILGRETDHFLSDTILSDTQDGAYKAIVHLIKNGHENIAYIGDSKDRSTGRLAGYKAAMTEYGFPLQEHYIYPNVPDEASIYTALDTLLLADTFVAPSALFVANYSIMAPLLKYIRIHNISCPDDLSIVSFHDFDWAPLHSPALTTIGQDVETYGKLAVTILLQRIKNQEAADQPSLKDIYQHHLLPTKINVRESTCGIGRGPFGEKAASPASLSLSESEIEQVKEKKLTAAISFHYAGKAWMTLHQKGIKEVFDNLGISLIATTDAHFDADLQCRQLDSLRMLDPDIIIAIPTDNHKTAPAFQRIKDSRAHLILIANVPDGLIPTDYVTCVSVNEHSHGRNMGHGLGEYMVHHGLTNAALITHSANFYTTTQRDNAALQVLQEEYPSIQICGNIRFDKEEEVYSKTSAFMKHHPEIEAFYISWDGPALEAIRALSDLNRSDIAIVTGDLDDSDALIMAKGGMIKMISAQCPYEQGQAIALAAAKAALNQKTPSFIGIEPISVTPDNLLKSWTHVFKEDPGNELRKAFQKNANYVSIQELS